MQENLNYCRNHPDVTAEYTCRQCRTQVCYNCKTTFFDHDFCSKRCLIIFLFKEFGKAVYAVPRFILFIIIWPFLKLKKSGRHGLFELGLLAGLAICLLLIFKMNKKIELLNEKNTQIIELSKADTISTLQPFISSPTKGGMVYSNEITIKGQADENNIIALSINEKLQKVQLPYNNKFIFKNIKLNRGKNNLSIKAFSADGSVSTLQTLSLNYATATLLHLAKNFSRGPKKLKQVALTFDCGSSNNISEEILDILKAEHVQATFFFTGQYIKKYKKIVKRIINEGHEAGNHTMTHPHLTTYADNRKHTTKDGITEEVIHSELAKTAYLFKAVTGKKLSPFWRAPFGEYNKEILLWAAQAGFKHIGWTTGNGWEETMDTFDWVADTSSSVYKTADEIVEKILSYGNRPNHTHNGIIILMHMGSQRKNDFPHKKLPEVINGLRKKGLKIIKISEMISSCND